MASYIHAEPDPIIMGKMSRGDDLIETLTEIVQKNRITLGRIEALGAVEKATLAFYNQQTLEYEVLELSRNFEITNLIGNVSIKGNQPMVHAHVTLSDHQGRAFGGHLLPGTIVFACEFWIQAFSGPQLIRGYDETTGLPLWEM